MTTSYYNTTAEGGATLARYRDQAKTQEERITEYFREASAFLYTPSQILEAVFAGEGVPITSVRRAMTNLTERGILIKTDRKREGAFGRPEYCWRRSTGYRQVEMFPAA